MIDAAEWIGPYDDEKLGFYKVAKNYYFPGFWEGNTQNTLYIGAASWDALPKDYQAAVELAASEAVVWMAAKYDAENPAALRRLLGHGITLRPFSREIMLAAYKAAFELYEKLAARNPRFKKVYDAWLQFRREEYTWFRISELSFDNFVASQIVQR